MAGRSQACVVYTVEFGAVAPQLVSHGHIVRLLPVTAVRTAASGGTAITIDTSGNSATSSGGDGIAGDHDGHDGTRGDDGTFDPNSCVTTPAKPGMGGQAGSGGEQGGAGPNGGSAGAIAVDVPSGSADSYVLRALGGRAGDGGRGGTGADAPNDPSRFATSAIAEVRVPSGPF